MIYTSSHKDWNNTDLCKTYSISGNRGKDANWTGDCYPKLAPKREFWKVWHDNIGKISEEDNNKYYIEEYYKQVLSKLDPEEVYKELNNSVLLCYEDYTEFCHRHIVAAWFELKLGVTIREVIATETHLYQVSHPGYIKKYLEEIMYKDDPKQIIKKSSNVNV